MDKEPKEPFDFTRAAFYLVATVIIAHLIIVLAGVFVCFWNWEVFLGKAESVCDSESKLTGVLAGALAAALAFAGRGKND